MNGWISVSYKCSYSYDMRIVMRGGKNRFFGGHVTDVVDRSF